MPRILVVGHNVRNVAESAKKAGYEVFAVTKYADADLRLYAEVWKVDEFDPKTVEELAECLNAPVVLASGCEDLPVKSEVLGTDPKVAEKVTNKLWFYRKLERAGIPYPELTDEPPCVVKPIRGGGGVGVRMLEDGKVPEGFISQRFVNGIPCSVSLLASEKGITPVSLNEILVGWDEMNARDFTYCGNVTPLPISGEDRRRLIRTAVDVVELFDVVGSVGVDFVLADEPYVLELNPRFQGSLDSVEWSLDVNVFSLHVRACNGMTSDIPKPKRFACRAVLFSDREFSVGVDLRGNPFYADVPNVGEVMESGKPVVSILASAMDSRELENKILKRKKLFYRLIFQ